MIELLIPLTLTTLVSCVELDCELTGGLGKQYDYATTNDYGRWIGDLRLTARLGDDFYIACQHISGISTREPDGGLNFCTVGFRVEF